MPITPIVTSGSQFYLYVAITVGIVMAIFAGILGFMLGRSRTINSSALFRAVLKGGTIGIVYDLDSNTVEIQPLQKIGNVFTIPNSKTPALITNTGNVLPMPYKNGRAWVYWVVKKGLIGMVEHPESLARLGITEIVLGKNLHLKTNEPNPISTVTSIIGELAKTDSNKTYTVNLANNVDLGIIFSPKSLSKALANDLLEKNFAVTETANDLFTAGRNIRNLIDRMFKVQPPSVSNWARYLIIFALIGLVALMIMYALSHPTTSPTTVTKTISTTKLILALLKG